MKHEDYAGIADFTEHLSEMTRAMVASLAADGFSGEQARVITTGVFSQRTADQTKKTADLDELLRQVWSLYLRACSCSMDLRSHCTCPASDDASEILREQLGDDWHNVCRERFSA